MIRMYYSLSEAVDYLKSEGVNQIDETTLVQAGAMGEIPLLVCIPRNLDLFIQVGDPTLLDMNDSLLGAMGATKNNIRRRAVQPIEQICPINLQELMVRDETQIHYIVGRDGDFTGRIESTRQPPNILATATDLLLSQLVLHSLRIIMVSRGKPENPQTSRNKFRKQEACILNQIKELGYNPISLPLGESGKTGIKGRIKALMLKRTDLFSSDNVYNKAWTRLKSSKEIDYH